MNTALRSVVACLSLFAALALGCSGSGARKEGQLTVPLEFRPTGSRAAAAISISAGQTIYVPPAVDERAERDNVGQNLEKPEQPVKILTSGVAPAEFVRNALIKEFRDSGMKVSDTASDATRLVTLRLVKFSCTETNTYATDVRANVTIASSSGATLWEGIARGESKRFGRSLSTGNYQQCFSDASVNLADSLLANAEVQKALSK